MNRQSHVNNLDNTLPMAEERDAHVYIFVDEYIHRPLKSLLVWGGYDRKDELVTECLATLHKIKYGYELRPKKAEIERTLGKEIVELLNDGNIKVHTLLDTPGGYVTYGTEAIWAMVYVPDSEAYITCQTYSMGAAIAENAVTRHEWEGGNMMWHLTTDVVANPNSPANIEKAAHQMKEIKDFFSSKANEQNRDALIYILESAIADPNRPDNIFYLSNRFLHHAGIIDVNHFTLQDMHTALCLSTGIHHEEVHKFFKVSEETVNRYGKFMKNYERKCKSLKSFLFPPTYKDFQTMRKEIRELFERKVRLR